MSVIETLPTTTTDERIERLNVASVKRAREIDDLLAGAPGEGQILPDELLSVAGLGLDLTPEQRRTLSREEVASILTAGVQFEAVLMAGFSLQVATAKDPSDPRVTYALHEIGEETRHSRLFLDLRAKIGPTARNPLVTGLLSKVDKYGIPHIIGRPALLFTLVLGGEEIPDMLQKIVSEHPDSDPHLSAVNRYHRAEEARHLAFARSVLPEVWAGASWSDRFAVRHVAPLLIGGMWDTLIHPGVYGSVGLPAWETWRAVRRDPHRVAMRHQATRPVLQTLLESGVLVEGRVPRGWRRLCGV